jgi:four helix bundle protein
MSIERRTSTNFEHGADVLPDRMGRGMTPEEMKQRTMAYALRVVSLIKALPSDYGSQHIGRQLLRAATSVAANYRASCRARSRADFVAKMGVVEEEADECLFWMELLIQAETVKKERLEPLLQEGDEILAIVVRSKKTARARSKSK